MSDESRQEDPGYTELVDAYVESVANRLPIPLNAVFYAFVFIPLFVLTAFVDTIYIEAHRLKEGDDE